MKANYWGQQIFWILSNRQRVFAYLSSYEKFVQLIIQYIYCREVYYDVNNLRRDVVTYKPVNTDKIGTLAGK